MEIHGNYDEKFALIVETFSKQYELGLDIGSSLALACEGVFVVDIWPGTSDFH